MCITNIFKNSRATGKMTSKIMKRKDLRIFKWEVVLGAPEGVYKPYPVSYTRLSYKSKHDNK